MLHAKQKGLTMIGWIGVLAIVGFFAIFIIKLFPIYYQGSSMTSIVTDVKEDSSVNRLSNRRVMNAIKRRVDINQIYNVEPDNDIKIKTLSGGKRVVTLDYEVREPFIFNIDLVVTFNEEVEIPPAR